MADHVVGLEGLLDVLQAQVVEGLEVPEGLGAERAVGAVGVGGQRELVPEGGAHPGQRDPVPPGLDLQLHPPVALLPVAGDHVEERRGVVHDPDDDAGLDVGGGGPKVLGQRSARGPQLGVEDGGVQRGTGHGVAAHRGEHGRDLAPQGVDRAGRQQPGDEWWRRTWAAASVYSAV